MVNKIWIFSVIGIVLLIGIVIAQGWTIPPRFTLNPNWAGLPIPRENQTIFGCKYQFPIELRDVKVYGYSVQGQNLNVNASFSLYTGNRTSTCGVRQKIFLIGLLNWENNIGSYIITQSGNNIRTRNNTINNPISTGGQG